MKNTPSRASKVLKIMDCISSVSRNTLILSWNKAHGMEPSVFDKDEYELTELSETEKPD